MSDFSSFAGRMGRRSFLGSAAAGMAGIALPGIAPASAQARPNVAVPVFGSPDTLYSARQDGGHNLPAIPHQKIDPRFLRRVVRSPSLDRPGSVIVDTTAHYLYFIVEDGMAVRYGVSLGKAGFDWTGRATIQFKKAWPVWTPPPDMIKRKPELAKFAKGMPAGPQSPLGARALYLFNNGRDTMYRLHGTPEWNSIGKNASSGCVRMLNQDVIDLYSRVNGPTPVNVYHSMYLGADAGGAAKKSAPTTEPIDAGVPEDAERVE